MFIGTTVLGASEFDGETTNDCGRLADRGGRCGVLWTLKVQILTKHPQKFSKNSFI